MAAAAARALSALFARDYAHCDPALDAGAAPLLVAALQRHPADAGVNQWACRALSGASSDVSDARLEKTSALLGDAGAVEALLGAARNCCDDRRVVETALLALRNITAQSERNCARAVAAGATPLIMRALLAAPMPQEVGCMTP